MHDTLHEPGKMRLDARDGASDLESRGRRASPDATKANAVPRILVTGAGGFIGAHFVRHILENTDWEVVGTDSWRHKGTPERVEHVLSKDAVWRDRIAVITHDLSVPFPERTKKRLGRADYIVNIASDSHVDRSIEDPVPFVQNNVNLALTMLEFARENPCKVFLQVSTDEVYGAAPNGVNYAEWSPTVPSNPYSASKACQEAIAISYWRTHGVPLIITNTMNNFGEMQEPEKYVPKAIRCIAKGEPVPVHGDAKRIGSRFYLHARNHADALLYILRKLPPVRYEDGHCRRPDRYNVVGDDELDNLQLAELIADMMGKRLEYDLVDFHATRPGHDRRYALDGAKLRGLGWRPPMNFQTSLKRCIDWTLARADVWL
jgi:dTDP-glucose 4,6-dehydratase